MLANQLIADAPDIHDPHVGIGLELLAQLGDENVHAAGVEETVVAPKGNQNRLSAQHVVGVLHEHSEDLGLAIGEAFDLVADLKGLLGDPEGVTTDRIKVRTLVSRDGDGAAQQRLHANDQLGHVEGLLQVVVAAQLEAGHQVVGRRAGGQEQDRDLRIHLPDRAGQGETIHPGHHHVEHENVGFGLPEGVERRRAVIGCRDHELALAFQGILDDFCQGDLILGEQ